MGLTLFLQVLDFTESDKIVLHWLRVRRLQSGGPFLRWPYCLGCSSVARHQPFSRTGGIAEIHSISGDWMFLTSATSSDITKKGVKRFSETILVMNLTAFLMDLPLDDMGAKQEATASTSRLELLHWKNFGNTWKLELLSELRRRKVKCRTLQIMA